MTKMFDGKVALVTGGSSGIGRETALAFAREGARVVIASRGVEGGKATVRDIYEAGGEARFLPTHVSVATEVEALVAAALTAYGRLDCAFNNAGIGRVPVPTHVIDEELWRRMIDVNLTGTWLCMKYGLRPMLEQGSGAIVDMSSWLDWSARSWAAPRTRRASTAWWDSPGRRRWSMPSRAFE